MFGHTRHGLWQHSRLCRIKLFRRLLLKLAQYRLFLERHACDARTANSLVEALVSGQSQIRSMDGRLYLPLAELESVSPVARP